MDQQEPGARAASRGPPDDRLDSWKRIAAYLKRDVSTVQRWERREAMPVHRHLHDKQGSVFAFRSELDAWWDSRRARLAEDAGAGCEPAAQATPAAASLLPESAPGRLGQRRRLTLAALALLLAGALTLVWYAAGGGRAWRSPLANAKFVRLPDFTGTEQAAAMSRDGKLIAFLADREGRIDAWVGDAAGSSYRNLTQGVLRDLVNPSIRALGFSPDSSLVTVWTRRADGSRPDDVNVVAIPAAGGAVRPYLQGAGEFDWSHDGRRLVYHTTAPGDPLFVREPDSGDRGDRRIYVAPAGVHCHFPVWSPDGAYIYFVRGVPPDHWDLWRIAPSGAALERITTHNGRVAYPVVLDRHTVVYLANDAEGAGPWMYVVDADRPVPHRISAGLESYTSLAANADGSRLVTTIASPRTSIWRLPLTDEGRAAARATSSGGPVLVSANGATPRLGHGLLLYVAWRADRQGIWTLTDGDTREIWSSAHARIVGGPALARDGRHIAFTVQEGEQTLLYTMEVGGSRVRLLADSLALRGTPAWAPDGQSVVSAVVREGEPRLTRIFLNGDPPLPLVSEYSVDPVWSPDGQFLVYSGADVGTTFPLRAAAADGRPHPLPSVMLTRGARRVAFLQDSQRLVILRGEIGHKDLGLLDLRTGDQRVLAALPPDFVVRDFDIADDGSAIVLDRLQVNSYLALIERPH